MTGLGLQTGLRALLTSRLALDTIGHNLANANTPGYSRQRVQLGSALPLRTGGLLIGNGVVAGDVQRSVDDLLAGRLRGQTSVGGSLNARLGLLSEMEALVGEPGEHGVSARLQGFFSSVSELSTAPSDSILQTGLVQATRDLTSGLNDLAHGLDGLRADTESAVGARVDEVNALAERLADLNVRIAEAQTSGLSPNDMRDDRDRLLGELSELVDVRTLEQRNGEVRVLLAGNTLVGSSRARRLEADRDASGELALRIEGAEGFLPAPGGALGGLLDLRSDFVPGTRADLDRLARALIVELNRAHSTGVPADGPFDSLVSTNPVEDVDGDGKAADELLANAGLPFDVRDGALYVNVTERASGDVEKHRIAVSSTHTTVQGFLDELNAIPNLSAELDSSGRLSLQADSGFGFDFARRVDPNPDAAGTFGGAAASLGTGVDGPFALSDGDTLELTVDSGSGPTSLTITLDAADFGDVSEASAEELAAVIRSDPAAQAAGLTAVAAGGRLHLQTTAEGPDASITLDGGSALGALGLDALAGSPVTGHDDGLEVTLSGDYDGAEDELTFVPRSDGTVGTTPGLVVDVLDSGGRVVASLEVGEDYVPGTELEVANGLGASFGAGELSATHGDRFALQVTSDGDTSDVLVALGLNGLLTGTGAGDVALREDLEDDPALLATSLGGTAGDNAALLSMLDVEEGDLAELDGRSPGRFYDLVVGEVGFETSTTRDALESNQALVESLTFRRDQVSGVNVDEELVDLVRFEQSFAAAARYIGVVNQLGDELLSLV